MLRCILSPWFLIVNILFGLNLPACNRVMSLLAKIVEVVALGNKGHLCLRSATTAESIVLTSQSWRKEHMRYVRSANIGKSLPDCHSLFLPARVGSAKQHCVSRSLPM